MVSNKKIFLFDFDGVIVDGMQEYWHSSLLACERYLNSPYIFVDQKLYECPEIMALAIEKAQKFLDPWKSSSFK